MELRGKYNTAIVFNDFVEEEAQGQIIELLNMKIFKDSQIRVMSDVHGGAGCVIGMTISGCTDYIIPNLVGVDIGCGMDVFNLNIKKENIDFEKLDKHIRKIIPLGDKVNSEIQFNKNVFHGLNDKIDEICKVIGIESQRVKLAVGSLGSGNHFIELNEGSNGNIYLIIHSGSRNFGYKICEYFQKLAVKHCSENHLNIPKYLSFLEGKDKDLYLDYMRFAQQYASFNRYKIGSRIVNTFFNEEGIYNFSTIHNYIDEYGTVRKGAVSSKMNEQILIPMNMKDGSLLCKGKGNKEWNYSAPHGAGRLMGRGNAKRKLSFEDFKLSMKGIYSTCINEEHIDEAPNAYKSMNDIIPLIGDTVDVIDILKPIYNLKG